MGERLTPTDDEGGSQRQGAFAATPRKQEVQACPASTPAEFTSPSTRQRSRRFSVRGNSDRHATENRVSSAGTSESSRSGSVSTARGWRSSSRRRSESGGRVPGRRFFLRYRREE